MTWRLWSATIHHHACRQPRFRRSPPWCATSWSSSRGGARRASVVYASPRGADRHPADDPPRRRLQGAPRVGRQAQRTSHSGVETRIAGAAWHADRVLSLCASVLTSRCRGARRGGGPAPRPGRLPPAWGAAAGGRQRTAVAGGGVTKTGSPVALSTTEA